MARIREQAMIGDLIRAAVRACDAATRAFDAMTDAWDAISEAQRAERECIEDAHRFPPPDAGEG